MGTRCVRIAEGSSLVKLSGRSLRYRYAIGFLFAHVIFFANFKMDGVTLVND